MGSNSLVPPTVRPGSDEDFQKVMLRIAAKASESSSGPLLIELFCRIAREFFQVTGVYFWRSQPGGEFIGEYGDGKLAAAFVGLQLYAHGSAVTAEAARRRRTIFLNQVRSATFPAAEQFGARSLMAAPLVVSNEVIGAVTFLHDADENFFNEDLAAKATILAGQLGSLLEAARLTQASREDHRKAEILADAGAGVARNSRRLRSDRGFSRSRALAFANPSGMCFVAPRRSVRVMRGIEPSARLAEFRSRPPRPADDRFAADLARRAVSAGEPILFRSAPTHIHWAAWFPRE